LDPKSIVITGANGQLGKALQSKYPEAQALTGNDLDISNLDQVQSFDWSNTQVIINAAAYTNVDGAETDEGKEAAWSVNADAVGNLARIAQEKEITLIHVSTDYVFDGSKRIHTESETFSPLSVYGKSKAKGDKVASIATKHYILRTSWVIGDGNNFVRTMLGLGEKAINPTVVADQIGRLTFTSELVRAIDHLLTKQPKYGTYNLSNSGDSVSWAEITRAVFKEAGYDLTVTDTTTEEYFAGKTDIAQRPLQSTLSLDKIHLTGFESHDWREDLKIYINAIQGEKS